MAFKWLIEFCLWFISQWAWWVPTTTFWLFSQFSNGKLAQASSATWQNPHIGFLIPGLRANYGRKGQVEAFRMASTYQYSKKKATPHLWDWKCKSVSHSAVPDFVCQPPLSMEFSRQGNWSGYPFPSPGDLPNPRIEPTSLMSPALADSFFTTSATLEASLSMY